MTSELKPASGHRRGVLRWLLVATHVPEGARGGGIVRYTVEIAAALARRDDVQLSVVCSREAHPFFRSLLGRDAVRLVPRLPTPVISLIERRAPRVLHRGEPYDVVQGVKHLVPARTSALRLLTVHDMLPFDRPQDFGFLKRALLRGPYLASLKDAEALACVSAATRRRLLAQLPAAADRAHVVPLAVSSALLAAEPQPVSALAGRTFALAVGDPSPRKNLALLVDHWDEVVARVPGAVLALAGPPSWGSSKQGEAYARLVRQGAVVALGRASDAQLRWCYENAVVTLAPSLVEGFGLPAVEALAFSSPLITSTDAALVEASEQAAMHLPPDRPDLWVDAVTHKFTDPPAPASAAPIRSWDDVAEETVAAVRGRLGR